MRERDRAKWKNRAGCGAGDPWSRNPMHLQCLSCSINCHVNDRRLVWIIASIDDSQMKPNRSFVLPDTHATILPNNLRIIAGKMSKFAHGSCGSQNFTCLVVRKCEKGHDIAIHTLTPDKITHRRVCIRIYYTNKTITSAGLIIRALYTVLRFLTRLILSRTLCKTYICSNFFKNSLKFTKKKKRNINSL